MALNTPHAGFDAIRATPRKIAPRAIIYYAMLIDMPLRHAYIRYACH